MSLYYSGTQTAINTAITQINSNCGFPDASGTITWAIARQAYNDNLLYFFLQPPAEGYKNASGQWTQAEMINGVTGVTLSPPDPNWWPPSPFPPNIDSKKDVKISEKKK